MSKPYFHSVPALVEFARSCHSTWFNEETMRQFGTKLIDSTVYGNEYFVTYEGMLAESGFDPYMVRRFYFNGDDCIFIESANKMPFKTYKDAIKYINDAIERRLHNHNFMVNVAKNALAIPTYENGRLAFKEFS